MTIKRKDTPIGKQEKHLREKYAPKLYVTALPVVGTWNAMTTARTPEEAERKFRSGEFEVDYDDDVELDFEKIGDLDWSLDIKLRKSGPNYMSIDGEQSGGDS